MRSGRKWLVFLELDVFQTKYGVKVKPNAFYIVPPNYDLAILHGVLLLFPPPKIAGPRMPIDYFFRSLAQDQGKRAICKGCTSQNF